MHIRPGDVQNASLNNTRTDDTTTLDFEPLHTRYLAVVRPCRPEARRRGQPPEKGEIPL